MARLERRLTKSVLDGLRTAPGRRQQLFWDSELVGFGVLVSSTGAKTFVVKRRNIRMVVERANVISVEQARQRAMELLAVMGRGENPIRERRERAVAESLATRSSLTVAQVWDEYRKAKKQLRPKTTAEYDYQLRKYCGDWMDSPLKALDRPFIASEHTRIRELVASNQRSKLANGHSTANSVMRLVRALWNFADANELVPDLGKNPVQALSRNRAWYPEPPREHFIPENQLPTFYAAINGYASAFLDDPWAYRDLIRLMLYTGLRLREAMRLQWDNVDIGARLIRLSADETKAKRRLDLPMSSYVEALLAGRRTSRGSSSWVFPGTNGHVSAPQNILRSAAKAIAKAQGDENVKKFYYNPHSLRRTFVTVAESCDLSSYTLKALVNHSFGDDITASYIGRDVERLRLGAQRVADRLSSICRPHLMLETSIVAA